MNIEYQWDSEAEDYVDEMGFPENWDFSHNYFVECCERGDIERAEYTLKMNPNIPVTWENNYALTAACAEGHLNVVKWFFQMVPDADIWCPWDSPFVTACRWGHLDIVKWLYAYSKKRGIVPNAEVIDCAFRAANKKIPLDTPCKINRRTAGWCETLDFCKLKVATWLEKLNPEKYVICLDDEKKMYKGYKIRTLEEIKWERRKYAVWLASKQCPEKNKISLLYKLPTDVSRYLIKFI